MAREERSPSAESAPPSPPRGPRLRLVDRLEGGASCGSCATECPDGMAAERAPTSATSSARSLKLSRADSLECTTAPVSVLASG